MNSSILTVNELTKKYYSKSVNLFNKKTKIVLNLFTNVNECIIIGL